MTQQHPQRCETCKRPHLVPDGLSRHPHFICGDLDMPYDTATVTSIRGCASQSDFQSERGEAMDRIFNWCISEEKHTGETSTIGWSDYEKGKICGHLDRLLIIKDFIAELRD